MTTDSDFSERVEIFFGEASDAQCRVYARLRGPEARAGLRLAGSMTGPNCLYAETLPATFDFADRGPGDSLVAAALVPEPCFWTPEMPHQYRVDLRLERNGDVLARACRPLGIRTLGAAGHSLLFDGERWVLRGVRARGTKLDELATWHESDTVLLVDNPDDALCREASRVGVLIVAVLDSPDFATVERLSRWPAVGIVALAGGAPVDLNGLAHNMLLAQCFAAGKPVVPEPWAHIGLCEIDRADQIGAGVVDCRVPVLAMRASGHVGGPAEGRALCDRLQRDLAPHAQFAGYIV
jgi:hypothetical protein